MRNQKQRLNKMASFWSVGYFFDQKSWACERILLRIRRIDVEFNSINGKSCIRWTELYKNATEGSKSVAAKAATAPTPWEGFK